MKNMLRLLGIILLLGGTTACGDYLSDIEPSPLIGEPFTLKYAHSEAVSPDNLFVTFVGVEEDSRCPTGVQCLWAGQVIIKVKVQKGSESVYEKLGLGTLPASGIGSEAVVFGRTVKLLAVNPYPEEFTMQLPIPERDYRIDLVVE